MYQQYGGVWSLCDETPGDCREDSKKARSVWWFCFGHLLVEGWMENGSLKVNPLSQICNWVGQAIWGNQFWTSTLRRKLYDWCFGNVSSDVQGKRQVEIQIIKLEVQ